MKCCQVNFPVPKNSSPIDGENVLEQVRVGNLEYRISNFAIFVARHLTRVSRSTTTFKLSQSSHKRVWNTDHDYNSHLLIEFWRFLGFETSEK